MAMPFHQRSAVVGVVKRRKRRVDYHYKRTCWVCGVELIAARPSADCCSATCRKQKLRIKRKAEAEADRLISEAAAKKRPKKIRAGPGQVKKRTA